jgi:hypothetical protein
MLSIISDNSKKIFKVINRSRRMYTRGETCVPSVLPRSYERCDAENTSINVIRMICPRFLPFCQRFQNVLPTFSESFVNVFRKFCQRFQNVLPTFSERFVNIFKTVCQHFQNVLSTFSERFINISDFLVNVL